VFIDGCFWHGCPVHRTSPKTNTAFWSRKVTGNVERDHHTTGHLESVGWTVLRLWEHMKPEEAVTLVFAALEKARRSVP